VTHRHARLFNSTRTRRALGSLLFGALLGPWSSFEAGRAIGEEPSIIGRSAQEATWKAETPARITAPRVLLDRVTVALLDAEPNLVTPVGIATGRDGVLYVIESHTHFPPQPYDGPTHDRLYRYVDTDSDGNWDRRDTVLDRLTHSMQVFAPGNGWVYVSTRSQVVRFEDTGASAASDPTEQVVATFETAGNYPHNGLSGLTFDPQGRLVFGMGENFGVAYELVGRDGKRLRGGGEGGNIYRCQPDGSQLERIATGIWNPFGLCFDDQQRLWCVENDPDASPPCRLLPIVEGGDYGFQFRFGRAGTHPLQCWNGELPGTVGYVAGTGEAPCAVVYHRGWLWVTSWGDNRIERYRIESQSDGTIAARQEIVVQGDTQFRPTGMCVASDGSLLFSDWVDRSYTLHGKGRLWRLSLPEDIQSPSAAQQVTNTSIPASPMNIAQAAFKKASQAGPMLHGESSAARNLDDWMAMHWHEFDHPLGADALRGLLIQGLQDSRADVRWFALRWAAERQVTGLRDAIVATMQGSDVDAKWFRACLATIDWLEHGAIGATPNAIAGAVVSDGPWGDAARALALPLLPADHPALAVDRLVQFAQAGGKLGREATRSLALRADTQAIPGLASIAANKQLPDQQRADAVMGLARDASGQKSLLEQLAANAPDATQVEAKRVLAQADRDTSPADRPADTDSQAWLTRLEEEGNREAGWRTFFRPGGAGCANCHAYEGRGAGLGPDLSTLATTQSRERVLQSILQPSREVGPMYVPWQIVTVDGRAITAMKLHAPGIGEKVRYLTSDAKTFDLELTDIESQTMAPLSIMPEGLHHSLRDDELRDLMSLLHHR
jgi:putative membrane-bound dehydrogenase-like protein